VHPKSETVKTRTDRSSQVRAIGPSAIPDISDISAVAFLAPPAAQQAFSQFSPFWQLDRQSRLSCLPNEEPHLVFLRAVEAEYRYQRLGWYETPTRLVGSFPGERDACSWSPYFGLFVRIEVKPELCELFQRTLRCSVRGQSP
jgi:hypothetical protein